MTLFVDKLIENDLGGITNDLRKVEYILASHGLSFEEILNSFDENVKIPSSMFVSGKYVVAFNIEKDLSKVNLGFINSDIDLDSNFDVFADSLSPKAVAGYFEIQRKLKSKKLNELNKIILSDNNYDFELAYKSYIEYKNKL